MDHDVSPLELHVLGQMLRDRDGNGLRTVTEYEAMFEGFEQLVRSCFARLTSDAAPESAVEGELGHFTLLDVAGRGGQGTVWRARDQHLDRQVAIKVLSTQLALHDAETGERLRRRFEREAIAAARLDDPGICSIYEVGEDGGIPWIAMQWVEGSSLDRCVSECRAATEPAQPMWHTAIGTSASSSIRDRANAIARLVAAAARSLHQAHLAGLVHRDLKPGNLMLTPDGRAVVLDFGLALDDHDDTRTLTRTGDTLGSPAYMSPEQLEAGTVDRRCDVYALGVTLFECLALRRPFEAETRERLFRAIRLGDRPPLRSLVPQLSPELAHVVACATDRDPDRRYETAAAFADDLQRVLAGEPILARTPSLWLRTIRWMRNAPALATTILVVLLLTATIAIVQGLAADELRDKNTELDARERAASWSSHVSSLRLAAMHIERGELEQATVVLDASPERHRDFCWHHLRLSTDESDLSFASAAPMAGSRNGQFIISMADERNAEVRDGTTGESLARWPVDQRILATAISDDGRIAAVGKEDRTIAFLDARTGAELRRFGPCRGWVVKLDLHPEGERVAVQLSGETGKGHAIRVFDRTDGAVLPPEPFVGQRTAFVSRDKLVVTHPRNGVDLVDVATGKATKWIAWTSEREFDAVATCIPRQLVAVANWQDSRIEIHDLKTGGIVRCSGEHRGRIYALRFDATGRFLISLDGNQLCCVRSTSDGKLLRAIRGSAYHNLSATPDGTGIWGQSGTRLALHRIADSPAERLLSPGTMFLLGADGNRLHVAERGSLVTRDLATGAILGLVRRIVDYSGRPMAVGRRDGRELVAFGYQNGSIELLDTATSRSLRVYPRLKEWFNEDAGQTRKHAAVDSIAFSSDGERMLVAYLDGCLRLLSTRGHDELSSAILQRPVRVIGRTQDGVFYVRRHRTIARLTADDPDKLTTVVTNAPISLSDTISDDGRWFGSHDASTGVIWDLETGATGQQLVGHRLSVHMAFDPDAKLVLTAGGDRALRIWDRATGKALLVRHYKAQPQHLQMTPDGSRMLFVHDGVRVLESSRPSDTLRQQQLRVSRLAGEAARLAGKHGYLLREAPDRFRDEVLANVSDPQRRLALCRHLAEFSRDTTTPATVARLLLLQPNHASSHQHSRTWMDFCCHRSPDAAGYAATRALAHVRLGEPDEARRELARARTLAGHDQNDARVIACVQALLAVAAGSHADAQAALQAARAETQSEPSYQHLLKDVEDALQRMR